MAMRGSIFVSNYGHAKSNIHRRPYVIYHALGMPEVEDRAGDGRAWEPRVKYQGGGRDLEVRMMTAQGKKSRGAHLRDPHCALAVLAIFYCALLNPRTIWISAHFFN